ncbi:MAG: elongation factor G [Defluviitaleaceae bacterium]|nr:elongation factor G [Defluviitaleaceae bacterium]MCL2263114.1 elongation factor G [Defluviitaleaceae bacterium]
MKVYSANEIRNIAVMGHSGCGKTTLMEAALHITKVTNRMGRTDDGNTMSDYDAEEIKRKVSVSSSLIPIEWNNSKLNFIDTPGFFDFVGATKEALSVSDAALILVAAKSGVEVGTELAWENAEGKPRVFFVNGMDDPNANFYDVVAKMRDMFGGSVAPLQLPFAEGGKIVGYVDTFTGKAYKWNGADITPCDTVPADMLEIYDKNHSALLEAVAETSEELMEKYFEEGKLSPEEMTAGLKAAIKSGSFTPVLCGTATGKDAIGVASLLDMLTTLLPSAAEVTPEISVTKAGATLTIPCAEAGPVCAFVFKTISDPFVGRLSLFRIYSGTMKKDTPLFNANKEESEKIGQLVFLRGKNQIDATEVRAGDIGAIAKLSNTETQDTLSTKQTPFVMPQIAFPESLLSRAVSSKGKGDEDKMASAFAKLLAEDRTLKFEINKETKQTVVSGIGDNQLDVLVNRLKTRYKIEVELSPPLIPYRETIKGKSDVKGKFVKQSGGGGQYGIVDMKFEPSGDIAKAYVFDEVVVGGNVPKQYFPAVEKGIQESVKAGPVAAYPVVGVKATLYDGKYHAVDSSELAFKMAAKTAFKDGFMQAKPTILEPIMRVTVTVPENYTGDIMGDMNKRRGRVQGQETVGKKSAIIAEVPLAEMQKYPIDLRSMTQGRGTFTMSFERYDEAPADVQQKVIAARKKELEAMKEKE